MVPMVNNRKLKFKLLHVGVIMQLETDQNYPTKTAFNLAVNLRMLSHMWSLRKVYLTLSTGTHYS